MAAAEAFRVPTIFNVNRNDLYGMRADVQGVLVLISIQDNHNLSAEMARGICVHQNHVHADMLKHFFRR